MVEPAAVSRWEWRAAAAGDRKGEPELSKSILLVEDEAAIREMVHLALSRIGFETRTVADAVRAEREIEQERPDLILLDWMLPGVSGLELARGLRRRESTRDIPLIMLTAKGEESEPVERIRRRRRRLRRQAVLGQGAGGADLCGAEADHSRRG